MRARLELLTPDECADVWERIEGLESSWIPRHDYLPSFTLGAAAYLDVPNIGVSTYVIRSNRANRVLRREFADILERLRGALAEHLDHPVVVTRRFAVPGFHIFRHHPEIARLKPRVHFDQQQHRLDFPAEDASNQDGVFSFTVPITIPRAGAGLYIWPRDLGAVPDRSNASLEAIGREVEPTYHGYRTGELFLHDGCHLHAIAADRAAEPGEVRVTLQGHGIRTRGAWQLYW